MYKRLPHSPTLVPHAVRYPCIAVVLVDTHAGSYCGVANGTQVPAVCEEGHFCPANSSTGQPCPVGMISNATGASLCHPCEPGTEEANRRSCIHCPVGQYSPNVSSSCAPCAPGQFARIAASRNCTLCAPGKFSSVNGSSACAPCPTLQVAASAGASTCSVCPDGQYAVNSSTACQRCSAGRYSNSTVHADSGCLLCSAGRYSSVGQAVCTGVGAEMNLLRSRTSDGCMR